MLLNLYIVSMFFLSLYDSMDYVAICELQCILSTTCNLPTAWCSQMTACSLPTSSMQSDNNMQSTNCIHAVNRCACKRQRWWWCLYIQCLDFFSSSSCVRGAGVRGEEESFFFIGVVAILPEETTLPYGVSLHHLLSFNFLSKPIYEILSFIFGFFRRGLGDDHDWHRSAKHERRQFLLVEKRREVEMLVVWAWKHWIVLRAVYAFHAPHTPYPFLSTQVDINL